MGAGRVGSSWPVLPGQLGKDPPRETGKVIHHERATTELAEPGIRTEDAQNAVRLGFATATAIPRRMRANDRSLDERPGRVDAGQDAFMQPQDVALGKGCLRADGTSIWPFMNASGLIRLFVTPTVSGFWRVKSPVMPFGFMLFHDFMPQHAT